MVKASEDEDPGLGIQARIKGEWWDTSKSQLSDPQGVKISSWEGVGKRENAWERMHQLGKAWERPKVEKANIIGVSKVV